MTILLMAFVLAALVVLVYTIIRYLRHPQQQLERAHKNNEFFIYDDLDDASKNFVITYKGAMFEGVKKVGSTDHSFEVIRITLEPKRTVKLEGLQYDDFMFMEKEIKGRYPHATIEWESPIKELIQKQR